MGIKFSCPNGHRLNVKAFLAGKRAKCPQCGAKVLVPRSSNGADEHREYPRNLGKPTASPTASTRTGVTLGQSGSHEAKSAPWFVRVPTGDQYGPASDDTVAAWIREGRVSPDSWVWHEGWTDWQPATEGLAHLRISSQTPLPQPEAPREMDIGATASHSTRFQRKRQERMLLISGALGVAVVILLVILVWILSKAG